MGLTGPHSIRERREVHTLKLYIIISVRRIHCNVRPVKTAFGVAPVKMILNALLCLSLRKLNNPRLRFRVKGIDILATALCILGYKLF